MRAAIVINCRFIPCRKCRWTTHRSIWIQKAEMHQCSFWKNCCFFYNQKLHFFGRKCLQTMAVINKIMTTIVQGECLSVTAYKLKKYDFLNVWRPVVRHDFIYGANVFLLHSGTRVDANQMWKYKPKDGNCSHATYTIFFYLYTIPPRHLN